MLFNIAITKMKLNDRNKRYDIIVNFISAKILAKAQIYYSYVCTLRNTLLYLSNLSQEQQINSEQF